MDKLIKKLDEIFEKYGVEESEIAEVGQLIADLNGELNTDGEEFNAPEMDNAEEGEPEE